MADDKYEYGRETKSIRFGVTDDDHARLLIRLRHNKLNAAQFFRAVIDGLIEQDPHIISFLDGYVAEHKLINRNRIKKSLKLKKKGEEVLEDWGFLDDAEKENIFDLISKEFPDL
tara:strand:+ start:31 stop:375 length:345 start_codon:yes stop_codon:yes gene_type:complete